ncbi:serine O-acetyltransferase [Neorhizobium sp. P12A]|uniref:serine O-acetyltransferase n=1 Tax=Neorhizobium sp. P12A TaxID=2268027 RepID=UPI0011EDBA9F|nr:serine O-acetyltransferase [Neorhizobium sp. P12A]KAA0701046.1 serine O-acetyltransferase [Neorhizobium sp. P12A]
MAQEAATAGIENTDIAAHAGGGIASADLVWDQLRIEAADLANRERLLRPLLREQIITAPVGADMLAGVLAARLSVAGMGSADLLDLFRDVLTHNPEIITGTEVDLVAVRTRDPACTTYLHAFLNLKGFHALQTHRIAHALWVEGRVEMASWLSNLASLVFGPDIHPAASLGSGIMLDHGSGIVIGETAVIEDEVSILQNVTLGGTGKETGDRHPKIRRGVMIGAGAKILGNIEIGAFSKVAAGSVVVKPVPAHCTVAGVPATVVRIHRADEIPAETMDQNI